MLVSVTVIRMVPISLFCGCVVSKTGGFAICLATAECERDFSLLKLVKALERLLAINKVRRSKSRQVSF